MIGRFRSWRDETHGAGLELLRHFLARFFDSEMAAAPGEWLKVAIGLFAMLLSAGILVLKTYMWRYTVEVYAQPGVSPSEVYRTWIRGDLLSFIGVAMALTALLTILLWQSLFPSERDLLALAGLPVSARQIFRAKFCALVLLFAAYVLAMNLPVAISFAAVTSGPLQENPSAFANTAANFSATAGACVFVFFGLLALQGVLLNVLSGRSFARVSHLVQAALFIVTLGGLPLLRYQPAGAAWWPPIWFLRLWEAVVTGRGSPRNAALAIVLPTVLGVLAYLASYHRYRRILLEAPPGRSPRWTRAGSWLLERWIREPREQAAFAFVWKTLARSRGHRLVLQAYAGIALGWIVSGMLDTSRPSLRDEGMHGLLVVLAPLAVSMLMTVGLRYVFSLPVSLEANWLFRSMDRDGRGAWLGAVERFVVWCGLAPVFLAGLPAAIAVFGWLRAAAATVLGFLAALVWFEAMFRQWRKLPFTCSYLPGKRPAWLTVTRYCLAIPFLAPAAKLILTCSGDITAFVALVTPLALVWWKLRTRRRGLWSQCALCYEEAAEAAVMELGLEPTSEPRTQPVPAAPQPASSLFSAALVASHGLLPEAWAEEIQEDRRHPWLLLDTFLEDLRYGLRLVCRNPLFSSIVVLTLTVGIGINAGVFTVANGLAFRPLVYKDPASFFRVIPVTRARGTTRPASYAEYAAFRDRSRSVRQLAAYAHFPAFIGEDNSAGSVAMAVSCNFFQVDGLDRAILGRLLTLEDCYTGSQAPVALISQGLWRSRFASDPRIIGRVVGVNSRPVTIVGIVPERTAAWTRNAVFTRPPSIFLPYTAQACFEPSAPDLFASQEDFWLSLAGRLRPGFSRSNAEAELDVLARQQDLSHRGRNTAIVTTEGSWLEELQLTVTGQQLMLMAFFLGALNLVLFISCANVATLLLARGTARRREIAVRLSLGSPRIRLIRMLVTESLLLAVVAGAASLYLAWRLPEPLFRLLAGRPPDFPMPVDWRTFAYVAGIVMLTGIVSGLVPALESVKAGLSESLKGGSPATAGVLGKTGGRRLLGWLVSAQVAMSMLLLVGAALFAWAQDRTLRADPGFLAQKVVVAPLYFSDNAKFQDVAVRLLDLTERARALPGARSVAFSEGLPLFSHVTVELRPPSRPDASQPVDVFTASPGFFDTLGVPLVRGRDFRLGETTSVVVSESLGRAFWRGQDPIGQALSYSGAAATVIGVVRDVAPMRFGGSENPAVYRPWRPDRMRNVLSVRFDAGAETGAAAVRAVMHEIDPALPATARLAQSWIDQLTEDVWNVVALILILGLAAALLATTGIYGAVSFSVNQRTRELGIRMALGASRLDITREIFVSGGKPVVRGLLVGLWLSVAAAAGLRQSLQGSPIRLDTANPLLYCGTALLLAAVAVLAMLGPAHRGARSDPLTALRCD